MPLESWPTCFATEKVFLGILEKTRYLEKLLRLLEVKDSPTLSLVFR